MADTIPRAERERGCLVMSNRKVINTPSLLSSVEEPTVTTSFKKRKRFARYSFVSWKCIIPSTSCSSWNNPNSLNLSSEGLLNPFLLLSSGHSLSSLDFLQSWIGQSTLIRVASHLCRSGQWQCPGGNLPGDCVCESTLWTLEQLPKGRDDHWTTHLRVSSSLPGRMKKKWFYHLIDVPSIPPENNGIGNRRTWKQSVVLPRNTPHVFAYITSLEPYNKPVWWVFLFLVLYRRNWGSEISYLEMCWRKNMWIWPSWNFMQLAYVFLPAFKTIDLLEASSALMSLLNAEVCARPSSPPPGMAGQSPSRTIH